jgi:hypothetical protein
VRERSCRTGNALELLSNKWPWLPHFIIDTKIVAASPPSHPLIVLPLPFGLVLFLRRILF